MLDVCSPMSFHLSGAAIVSSPFLPQPSLRDPLTTLSPSRSFFVCVPCAGFFLGSFYRTYREPMGRVLYNRLVDIRDKVQPRSHGNFLPSLDQVEQLLRLDANHPNMSLLFLFLSDGKPSDNATGIMRGSNQAVAQAMCVLFCFVLSWCCGGMCVSRSWKHALADWSYVSYIRSSSVANLAVRKGHVS